jgi:hypothetical protein
MPNPREQQAVPPASDDGQRFAAVAAVFARRRDVVQRRMFNTENALAVDGKIFTMLTPKGAFVVKLPKDRVDALVEAGAGERFGPGARKMKEWVAIDPAADADWVALANEAYGFVKPKD